MKVSSILATSLVLVAAGAATVTAQEPAAPHEAILADLEANNLSAEEILAIRAPGSVDIVELDSFTGADLQRLEETLGATEDGAGEVQAAIERNEALEASVREQDVSILDLVAATRSEGGEVTLYIDKPRR